ncbi:MAG: ABC transporter permease [Clostridia bacterium]|nr:ABC transporter permease [Clostridia bacterium]
MNLKTKSFKKSIFNADIRQLWIFSLIYGGIIFFGTFFDFYLNNEPYGNAIPYSFVNSRFFSYSCLSNFFGICAGSVLALRLFAYLYSTNAISFYHGLPFKRKSIFVSKVLSGAVLLIVPVLINFAIIAVTKLCGSSIQIRWLSLIYWLANQLIYSLLAFSCVTFAVMLSGNILALLGTCILLGIAPLTIIGFIHIVCQNYLLGYAYDPTNFFSLIYITPDVLLFKTQGLIYIFAIPALLIITYFMYKKRDLERCGEAVVFPKLKIVFIYFAGLLGGIFSYFYFSIWNFKTLLFMLPFGIVAVIVANMINKRGVTLKGAVSHTVIFTAFVLFLLGAFRSDIIGFQKRVPAPENIESVTVIPDRYYAYRGIDDFEKCVITDKEDIKKITAYHAYNTEKALDRKSMPSYVEISYKLKNGRTLKRGYYVNFTEEKEHFESVAGIEQVKKALYPIYKAENLQIVNIDLHNFMDNITLYPNNEITKKLIEAINDDIKNLSYDENAALLWNSMNCNTPLYVDIEYKNPDSNKPYANGYSFPISFGFTKTMELLKEYGYYDRFMTVKNIVSVGIDRNDDEKGNLAIKDYTVDEIITDTAKMQEILDMFQNSYKNPVWHYDGTNEVYDEYIFLDKDGTAHSSVLLQH